MTSRLTGGVRAGRATQMSGSMAREAFLRGVLRAGVEHTLRLMAAERWPFWAAALVAQSELAILLHILEEA